MTKPVPIEFGANGLAYRQVKRAGLVAFYEVRSKMGKLYGFEVVVLKITPAGEIMGEQYPEREVYPGNEKFGVNGWYFMSREDAERRFNQLQEARNLPPLSQNVAVLTAEP